VPRAAPRETGAHKIPTVEPKAARRRSSRTRSEAEGEKSLHLGCLVAPKTHYAVRAHAAQKGMTIRRLLLTTLREAGVPIPAREIEEGHR
jgi:hypothetical protein